MQFVDTNVLIYAHDVSAGQKHDHARQLIHDLWQSGEGCLSVQVLQEFYVTVTQKVPTPLSPNAAAQVVADLALWEVHCPRPQDVMEAIHLQQRYQTSFWDAMILASAIQLGCQILWSEDLNPGQGYDQLIVQSPF